MEKIKYILEKYKIVIILSSLGIIILFSFIYIFITQKKKYVIEPLEIKEEIIEEQEKKEETVKVDIKGYVNNPGVYELDDNSRVVDVIDRAGGLKEEANTEYINLSKKIIDEMIIIIYSNNDVEKYKETEKEIVYIEYKCVCPDNINDTCITEKDTVNTNGQKKQLEENAEEKSNKLISINNASLQELMTLDGIGESKAKDIIKYREENGKFKELEDIMNVSGIGEKAYSKIKDSIKL